MSPRNKKLPDWRNYLSEREAQQVAEIEATCQSLDEQRSDLSRELFVIRNRAMQRRRQKLEVPA